jgi:hypothetical protein
MCNNSYKLEYSPDQECWHIERVTAGNEPRTHEGWHVIAHGVPDTEALQAFAEHIDSQRVFGEQRMPSPEQLCERFWEFYAGWSAGKGKQAGILPVGFFISNN